MKNPSTFDLWVLLAQTFDAIQKARQKDLSQYNIGIRQSAVLFRIQAIGDQATPAEISRWLLREPHSVSEILNRMEKAGLVRKIKDLDRKNLVRVKLTKKGREAYYKATLGQSIDELISTLSEDEQRQLWSCLQKLRDKALKKIGMEGKVPVLIGQWVMPSEHSDNSEETKKRNP